jgi:hypothetical protein
VELTGTTGLVMHNVQLADKTNGFAKEIAKLTDKGSRHRTEADDAEIERLEFLGGLYHDADMGVHVPTANVVKCFERGATLTRQGATLIRAVAVVSDRVPLVYDGPREPLKLWAAPEFHFRKSVGIQRGKVMRMRPIFRRWSLTVELDLLVDVLDPDDFVRIAEKAGRSEGLCDARKLGYGRFTVVVAH